MLDLMMTAAHNPVTPWIVLAGVGILFLVEAWQASHVALLGDMFAEGQDD